MKMFRFLSMMVAMLAASGSALAADGYKFAVIPKAMNNQFFDLVRDGCMEQAQKHGSECLYRGPIEHEPATQVQIMRDFITQGVDGIAISVADAGAVMRVIQQARDANIPIITFDGDAPDSARQASVSSDNVQIGVELGKLLLKLRPEGGKYAMISGGPAAVNLQERVAGVRQALKVSGWEEIASGSPTYSDDDAALALQQMHDLKTANPDLGAIIPVAGLPMWVPEAYRNFIDRYRAEFDAGTFSVVAADTLLPQLEALRDGYVNGLIGQRPLEMGAMTFDTLLALKEGGQVEEVAYSALDVITKDNIGDFLQ